MKNRIGIIALLLSALVFHDFFKIEAFKFGPLTLTYQRIIIMALMPMVLLPKFKINIRDKFLICIILFFLYGLFRISGNYREFLVIYFPLLTFILLYILIKNDFEIKFCINLFATSLIFFCFIGLIEFITGHHFVESYLKEDNTKWLATGMYYNENDFSAFITTMIFYMLLSNYSLGIKIISIAIGIFIVYTNESQICLLALITFAILYFSFRLENKKERLFLIICLILPVFLMRGVFIRIVMKSSLYWRFLMYKTGIQVCRNNLIFGTGIGNYENAMHTLGFIDSQNVSANPHCIILELSGQFGIIWTILLIILLISLFLFIYKSKFKKKVFLLGLVYIYPFIGIASSSSLGKNYTYLALLIPILLYKKQKVVNVKR